MTIRKNRADGVVADGLDALDVHVALAQLQHFLADAVAADFGRGREDPQELVAEFEALAVVEGDFHEARTLVKLDLGGNGIVLAEAGHGFPSLK